MKRKRIIWVGAATLVLAAAFQNCTKAKSPILQAASSSSSSSSSQSQQNGNGAGYDGKTYIALDVSHQCSLNTDIKSQMVVRQSDQHAFLTKENCQPVNPPRDVTDRIIALPPHPVSKSFVLNGFMTQGAAYSENLDYAANPADLTSFVYTAVRCAKTISAAQSLTIGVLANMNTTQFSGYIGSAYYWNPGTNTFQAIPTNNSGVSMTASPAGVAWFSSNPLWRLDFDLTAPDPGNQYHLKATFTYSDGANQVSVPGVDCYISQ
jgi:hypothetical protein